MKLFVSFSRSLSKEDASLLKQLLVFLEGRGHEILNKTLLLERLSPGSETMSESRAFELSMHWLKYAEFIIAEATDSYNTGLEIAHGALHHGKKTVVFYKSENMLPSHLKGCTLSHVYLKSYSDFESVRQMLTLLKL